jgi:hypothetical protein
MAMVQIDPGGPAKYHYAIYVHETRDSTTGGSHPEMIVPW